jgi:predicted ATP-grasp superfamily ATP-dependent carboligase
LHTREELDALLATDAWDPNHFVIQEFFPGEADYTTHAVAKNGRLLWYSTLRFVKNGETRFGLEFKTMEPFETPPGLLEAAERLLHPLDFSGPCNIDYTIREGGRIAVFEVNARFGGSMFLPPNRALLKQALTCLIENAPR